MLICNVVYLIIACFPTLYKLVDTPEGKTAIPRFFRHLQDGKGRKSPTRLRLEFWRYPKKCAGERPRIAAFGGRTA